MRPNQIINICLVFVVVLTGLLQSSTAKCQETIASAPQAIHYQAHLMDASGLNVDGDISLSVMLYDSSALGVEGDLNDQHLLYAEIHNGVHVDRGILRFTIGEGQGLGRFSGVPLPLEDITLKEEVYLELIINDERVSPRQRLGYQNGAILAQYAKKAEKLTKPLSVATESVPDLPASKVVGTLPAARIPQLNSSYLQGDVSPGLIPSEIPFSKMTSGYLNNSLLPDFSGSKITSGTFSTEHLPSTVLYYEDLGIAMSYGEVADKQMLPIPDGFYYTECEWIVSLNHLSNPVRGIDGLRVYTGGINGVNEDLHYPFVNCEIEPETMEYPTDYPIMPCGVHYLMICKH